MLRPRTQIILVPGLAWMFSSEVGAGSREETLPIQSERKRLSCLLLMGRCRSSREAHTRNGAYLPEPAAGRLVFASAPLGNLAPGGRTRAQAGEEFFHLARQRFRGRGQFARRRQDRCGGRIGLADGLAERGDIGDQRLVALGGRLRVDGDFPP